MRYEDFAAYCKAADGLAAEASDEVSRRVSSWCALHPSASVEECREAAKGIMGGFVQTYGDAAASLAAQWYDGQAAAAGAGLQSAVAGYALDAGKVDAVARYQAGKLVAGDAAGFARACGEYASNAVTRALNDTVAANVKRDKAKRVRFARIPSGGEACPFCLMLAGRGAVYHTRKTAGEFSHFHRNCKCRVVPGFENDPDAEIVEGFSPVGLRDRISQIEAVTGMSFADTGDSAGLKRYIRLLDEDWLLRGVVPSVDYSANPIENYGNPKHRRRYDFDNFETHDGEWRDVFAHDALASVGIKVKPLPASAPMGFSNIDLLINDELWEVKSPYDEPRAARNSMRFVEKNLRKAKRQFDNQWDEGTGARLDYGGPTRVVFNALYVGMADDRIEAELLRQMKAHRIEEVIFVRKSGDVRFLSQ